MSLLVAIVFISFNKTNHSKFSSMHLLKNVINNNDKYLYSALLCVTQRAVSQSEFNTILQGKINARI